ncbi:conserved hypothetical protein [Marininema mesophilum]|uniref:Purine nucleoside phosphorylase n=1 Tax=Marininema mesophilum TaxID=1048340 RepID=A0A1H2QCM9_9BACL|nr:peptidoglycan editing factor PgeF [Marininema mesophilum]SDW05017.1 conserved hypothetical protein [Marininema mesophilum]
MEPFQACKESSVPYFSLLPWEREFPRLRAGISTRDSESIQDPMHCNYALHIGDDRANVLDNRKRLAEALDVPLSYWTCGDQVHGTHIHEVTSEEQGRGLYDASTAYPATDGLITHADDVLLTSFYADCVPLLFYSPDTEWMGVAHAGWRGTVGGIGRNMVEAFHLRGASLANLRVAIAPSIGRCCYEVDEHVTTPLLQALPHADERVLQSTGEGGWRLDLKEANRQILLQSGLFEEHIFVSQWCTSCHPAHFHSHRRDRGNTGRMVAYIGRRKG